MRDNKEQINGKAHDDWHYHTVNKISNVLFEYLTKLTLVGVLHQLAKVMDNATLKVVAAFFTFVLTASILFGILRMIDVIIDEVVIKINAKLWHKLIIGIIVSGSIMFGYNYYLNPAIKEVISYYSSGLDLQESRKLEE